MMERELDWGQRVAFTLTTAVSLLFFVGFGWAGLVAGRELPWQARAGFLAGSLFGLAFAVLGIVLAGLGYALLGLITPAVAQRFGLHPLSA
jgi:hypothetical protein